MKHYSSVARPRRVSALVVLFLTVGLLATPLLAQQPVTTPGRATAREAPSRNPDPTFDNLLAVDRYKLYGEVRNVGQLLTNGGAGEIAEPIIKLAEPGKEFNSIISFLKKNSETLSSSRLMFAAWPARTDVPAVFVAIEFPTNEDAAKFAPKLETFLPTVLPPVPVVPEAAPAKPSTPSPSPAASPSEAAARPISSPPAKRQATPPPEERLPFVITHSANLVFITDRSFKFEKLHPRGGKLLFQDQNFRTIRDKFSSEPVFLFINVALEDKTQPVPSPTPVLPDEEAARLKAEDTDESPNEMAATAAVSPSPENPSAELPVAPQAVLVSPQTEASPAPTPTKEQQAQMIASNQIGQLLDAIGYGEPQWPDAVGLALALEGDEYIVRGLLIDKQDAKRLPIPFVPQLISGPPYATDAASVLPDDTDVLVSASIDLTKTYEGMRKEAEIRAKNPAPKTLYTVYNNGALDTVAMETPEPQPDVFTQFEKKAKFKIKDDLLSVLGNEIALAGSLKTLQSFGGMNLGIPAASKKPLADSAANPDDEKKPESKMPILLVEIKDRDAVRKLMPKVLDGLGIGEANLIAQVERRDDTETVNYAGMFAYAFVGKFLVISDAVGVHHLVDAYLNHQTLSANSVFHNSRRWQSGRTLGQVYISPALMESYHDQIRKQAGTMDQAMRDFLLSLDPRSEAITYALSNDGLGTQHELHLPKNLILTTVASISSASKNPPPEMNEVMAMGSLRVLYSAEETYQATTGNGHFGTVDQLIEEKLLSKDMFDRSGYKFDITATADQFEAVAVPREYGKDGKRSFFIDKSGVLRGDDHGGGPATIADKSVQE